MKIAATNLFSMQVNTKKLLLVLLVFLTACGGGGGAESNSSSQSTQSPSGQFSFELPNGFPEPAVPQDNPMSSAKVELGRYLFYDTKLSGNETQSCSSCHLQERAFTDGKARSIGSTGEMHPRNANSLTNAAYNTTLTWSNPLLRSLEQQIAIPLFGEFPVELGVSGREALVLERLRSDSLYQELYPAAFPGDEFTLGNVIKALASFTRTMISSNSSFDRFVYQNDDSALSESAGRGLDLFFSERLECHHCHGGFNFTLSSTHSESTFVETPFHNTGLFNIGGDGSYPPDNQGLIEFTQNPSDMGKFRAPTLRNLSYTAPYMHDGSFQDLASVIRFYEAGGRNISEGSEAGDGRANPFKSGFVSGFSLSPQERIDLENFLRSLDDPSFISKPELSNPFR